MLFLCRVSILLHSATKVSAMSFIPTSPHRDLKFPISPQGRSFSFMLTYPELQVQIQRGKVGVGSAIGTSGPACGDIVVRRSGSNTANPNRLYSSCSAQSAAGHKAFVWLEPGAHPTSSTSKGLFEQLCSTHLGRRYEHGVSGKWSSAIGHSPQNRKDTS